MAGIKISQLPAVPSALLTDFFPIVQGGVTSQETLAQVATLFGFNGSNILGIPAGGTGVGSVTISPTASAFAGWDANSNLSAKNFLAGYTTTVTAAATTTLTVGSTYQQFFTGTTTQTVTLPVTSTLVLGQSFYIVNNSTGVVTVQSSGSNTVIAMAAGTTALVTCILTSGTTAASWFADYVSSDLVLPVSLANGGTNASLTASNGGIFYSTATAGAILSGTATAGQLLLSGASAAPSWSTTTYPSTNAINTIMYASSANVLGVITPANSSVLVSGVSGIPAWSTTLPAFTTSSITFSPTTGGIVGTTTNDDAAAGKVGEYIESKVAQGSAVNLTNATAVNVTSISLTAGDWDVRGNVSFVGAAGTTFTLIYSSVSTVSATLPDTAYVAANDNTAFSPTGLYAMPAPTQRISLSTTTTVYLIAQASFAVSTAAAFGFIGARRVR